MLKKIFGIGIKRYFHFGPKRNYLNPTFKHFFSTKNSSLENDSYEDFNSNIFQLSNELLINHNLEESSLKINDINDINHLRTNGTLDFVVGEFFSSLETMNFFQVKKSTLEGLNEVYEFIRNISCMVENENENKILDENLNGVYTLNGYLSNEFLKFYEKCADELIENEKRTTEDVITFFSTLPKNVFETFIIKGPTETFDRVENIFVPLLKSLYDEEKELLKIHLLPSSLICISLFMLKHCEKFLNFAIELFEFSCKNSEKEELIIEKALGYHYIGSYGIKRIIEFGADNSGINELEYLYKSILILNNHFNFLILNGKEKVIQHILLLNYMFIGDRYQNKQPHDYQKSTKAFKKTLKHIKDFQDVNNDDDESLGGVSVYILLKMISDHLINEDETIISYKAETLMKIGFNYYTEEDYENSIKYYEMAIKEISKLPEESVNRQNDLMTKLGHFRIMNIQNYGEEKLVLLSGCYRAIGDIYLFKIKNDFMALDYFEKILKIETTRGDLDYQSLLFQSIGSIHLSIFMDSHKSGKIDRFNTSYQSAMDAFEKSIDAQESSIITNDTTSSELTDELINRMDYISRVCSAFNDDEKVSEINKKIEKWKSYK